MNTKIQAVIIAFLLVCTLTAEEILESHVNVFAQGEGANTGGMPGGEGMTGGGGMSADTNEMPIDEGITIGGGMTEEEDDMIGDLKNETGGMTEGDTDPNGEGEVDLGTGGP